MAKRASWVALLLVACAHEGASSPAPGAAPDVAAGTQPIPADAVAAVERARTIGRELFVYDKVSAIGTDVLLAKTSQAQRADVGGYLTLRMGGIDGRPTDVFQVSFFTREAVPRIAFDIRVAPDAEPVLEAFNPPKAAEPSFLVLVSARQRAIAAMPATRQPINPVVLPDPHGIAVYLIAGTDKPDLAVFGRHFRAVIAPDGTRVVDFQPLSKSELEVPTTAPAGAKPEALVVTHVLDDHPIETHVFTSLLTKMRIVVATERGLWGVDGADITYLGPGPK